MPSPIDSISSLSFFIPPPLIEDDNKIRESPIINKGLIIIEDPNNIKRNERIIWD